MTLVLDDLSVEVTACRAAQVLGTDRRAVVIVDPGQLDAVLQALPAGTDAGRVRSW